MIDLIHEFPDIDRYLEPVLSDTESKCKYDGNCLFISINLIDSPIKIHSSQLDKLCMGEEPNAIPSFKYLDSYGIKFKNYFEICISLTHHDYLFLDSSKEWRTTPLKFKIGNSQFEISSISALMVLLTEPIHSDNNNGHYDFDRFASIKFSTDKDSNFQDEFCKALFYLNSSYLKPIGFHAKLMRLKIPSRDPLDIFYENDIEDIFKKASRKRNNKRKDFISVEPINLYNEAMFKLGEQKFLALYRILEFFISRSILKRIADLRYNSSVSEEEILALINVRTEELQLRNLLEEVLSQRRKNELKESCFRNALIQDTEFSQVVSALYAYRNSLVHAKESQLNNTVFPNPFDLKEENDKWLLIIDDLALRCIRKYNHC